MNSPYEWLQSAIDQVPGFLQPLIVALAGAVPYIEAEGATAFGILAGINPILAALAGAVGNILCVVVVVLLGARAREALVTRSAVATPSATGTSTTMVKERPVAGARLEAPGDVEDGANTRRAKGRRKLRRWLVKFGVPGASILAPLALPTMLTAAFFVGSGVRKQWVILWQVVAIVLWTAVTALAATGLIAVLGW